MQDWLKKKGVPLFIGVFALYMLWDSINFFLSFRESYYLFGTAISGIFIGILFLVIAITTYFELNGKPAAGQVISIISGTLMLISWLLIIARDGDMIDTLDRIVILFGSGLMIFVGIFKLMKLGRGESITRVSEKRQAIDMGIALFILVALIIFMYLWIFGVFG